MDCDICCETINGNNKRVACGFCDASSCTKCAERYLLETHDDPHCMHCRKAWDRDILTSLFTKTFVMSRLRDHRKAILIDREKSLLPQTQPDVDIELANRERERVKRELTAEKRRLQERLRELNIAIGDAEGAMEVQKIEGVTGTVTTRKCPVDACRGFLNNRWVCGICEGKTCKDCHEPITGEDHVCDPNDVETMRLLKRDSKPCPSCGTFITKIDGCDQMWCTQPTCHTAFSWRTGKKVNGVIHNPHFIQFAAANNTAERNPQDVPCGGLPDTYGFFNRFQTFQSTHARKTSPLVHRAMIDEMCRTLPHMVRGIRHLIHVEERRYNAPDVRDRNTDLRVKYLLKEIDEKTFASTATRREAEYQKKKAFHDIIVMTMHTGSDIARGIYDLFRTAKDPQEVEAQVEILRNLRHYANAQFARVGNVYGCKYPMIKENWEFVKFC
jgi:hypothetical protein